MPRKIRVNKELLDLSEVIDSKSFLGSIKAGFSDFTDPREKYKTTYPAWYLLMIVTCGLIAGCDEIKDLAYFAYLRRDWFTATLGKDYGAPSYDTLWWFLGRTKPEAFKGLLKKWFSGLSKDLQRQVLAIDGKRLRSGSFLGEPVHLVELFATESGLTLYLEKVPEKKGETKVLSDILSAVNVEGAIVSGDALYTNIGVATQLIDAKADYILALKGNQSNLAFEAENFYRQAKDVTLEEADLEEHIETDDKHGRIISRRILVCSELEWLRQKKEWPGLESMIAVESTRKIKEKTSTETRYYISSCRGEAKDFAKWIRSHWAIENNLHWVADVLFKEDGQKASMGYSTENLGVLRRCAMNIVKLCDPKESLANARRLAAGCGDYLGGMMKRFFGKRSHQASPPLTDDL